MATAEPANTASASKNSYRIFRKSSRVPFGAIREGAGLTPFHFEHNRCELPFGAGTALERCVQSHRLERFAGARTAMRQMSKPGRSAS